MRSIGDQVRATANATARDRRLIAAHRGRDVEQGGDQLAALLDLARALTEADVPYALIGGIAVAVHADVPRATMDVDIAVPTRFSRQAVISVLEAAGFILRGEHEHSVNLRHPSGEPVQVAFDAAFDPMIERADTTRIDDMTVRVVTKDDLIASKERAAQDPTRRRSKALRDQADIELLKGDVPGPDEGW